MIPRPLSGRRSSLFSTGAEPETSRVDTNADNTPSLDGVQKEDHGNGPDPGDEEIGRQAENRQPGSRIQKFFLYFIEPELEPEQLPDVSRTQVKKPREKKASIPFKERIREQLATPEKIGPENNPLFHRTR